MADEPIPGEMPEQIHEGHEGEILLGSSTLPATYDIHGETVQLGTIVCAAYQASGLSEQAWNDLTDVDRDALLDAEIAKRQQPVSDPLVGEPVDPPETEHEIKAAIADEPAFIEASTAPFIDGDTPILMGHPDAGTCDAYASDDKGRIIVPAVDVPAMLSHGFLVAEGDA